MHRIQRIKTKILLGMAAIVAMLVSCERDFDLKLESGQPSLVVEGYINNLLPLYNYVVLTRSQSYVDTSFQTVPVTGAEVFITEGTLLPDHTIFWDPAKRVQLRETQLPQLNGATLPGVYFDTLVANNPNRALKGIAGKYYLLEVASGEQQYSAITALLPVIPIDSITVGSHFIDVDKDTTQEKARITVHYKDPDTIGNTVLYYWNHQDTWNRFGWGGMGTNRFNPNTDDEVNGQYIHLTHNNGFALEDSVQYYLTSVDRAVYNFWDSFNKARSNGGPFATPVTLMSNVRGEHVTGCFSGFSMSTRSVRIR